jgi:hypothetical protein
MKYFDAFCGIGGFSVAMKDLGHTCVGACDIDKECREIYKLNYNIEPHGYITKITEFPDFDIFCGGFPCQSMSNAGKKLARKDPRGKLFDHIIRKTDLDLKGDPTFWNAHGEFIEQNTRGYGYWIWKSYIIKRQLEQMKMGDVLVYADAGCELNLQGKKRLYEYIHMAKRSKNGIVGFQLKYIEHEWTKMDLIEELKAHDHIESGQVMGGVLIIRKCPESVALVNKWYSIGSQYHYIDDRPSIHPNHILFQGHRHDQSIFSILHKQSGGTILEDEVDEITDAEKQLYPIIAKRNTVENLITPPL